ncbi:pseudouridine synthase [Variovorax sp. RA8]|uniref:pseudouridine synthase n=1 Tax=Variovorax sp. (strain JCM 16519 / RA8) TaxID=662548 RepID=UPI001315F829|nr:pseudouridine synthase [Variovorax sp. RA8]VTU29330.1 Ribosomal large subunit pseudouridine synthase B [Variovorax sp. RA8]
MSPSDPEDAAMLPPGPMSEEQLAASPAQPAENSTEPAGEAAAEAPRKRRPRRRKPAEQAPDAETEAAETPGVPVALDAQARQDTQDTQDTPVEESPAAEPQAPMADPPRDEDNEEEEEDEEPDEEEDDLDRARRAAEREQRNAPPPEPIRFVDVVSGQFDADEDSPEVPPLKRVLLPEADSPKLHKVLAQAGLGSRLEMEQLILQGRISVNNEPAHIGQRIQFGDQVKLNGKPIRYRIAPPPARVIAYHKPVGEVVTHDDPQNRPTVFRKLPRLPQGKWQSVGRLDLNTEGLLLFTSSGELANQLMHPRFGLEREYAVRVLGALSNDEKQRLLEGVRLDDGMAHFGTIEDGGGEGSNCWYRVTISEGRNREVRRLFESVGHAVSRLIRIRYGAMVLPRGLKRGAWMELDERDIRALFQAAGAERPARGPAGSKGGGQEGSGRNNRNRKRRGNRNGGGGGAQAEGREPPIPNPLTSGPNARGRGGNGGPPQGQGGQARRNRQGGKRDDRAPGGGGGSSQPDPMKTSLGYIGADSFSRQRKEQRAGPRRGGGGGPSGGNFGGPGGQGGGRRRGR